MLQQPCELLLPSASASTAPVDDVEHIIMLQLGDDGTCVPALWQHEIRQVTVEVVSKVEHKLAVPFCQIQEIKQPSLLIDLVLFQVVDPNEVSPSYKVF